MKKELVTIKITLQTRKLLRIIAAATDKNIYEVVERLAIKEHEFLNNNSKPIKQKTK
jgi:hypothetical protein